MRDIKSLDDLKLGDECTEVTDSSRRFYEKKRGTCLRSEAGVGHLAVSYMVAHHFIYQYQQWINQHV